MKVVATNRDLNFKYEVIETFSCGIVLKGTEVKSLRDGKVNLKDGFAVIKNSEVILRNVYISHYDKGNINNVNELRDRKLLLHREEINKLVGKIKIGGYTLIPHKIGFVGQYAKIELSLCKGKKLYDKRETEKKKEAKRKIEQAIKDGRIN
ncbi:MAG: SsrA-binding protein SmpB [Clostridia bacterium]|nr:SsrA-binding protein SmpB [Clostridia bacterium]